MGAVLEDSSDYSNLYAGRIWENFRGDFELSTDTPAKPVRFETFGPDSDFDNRELKIEFSTGVPRIGFDLSSKDNLQKIYFQRDYFAQRWQRNSSSATYPRFENIADRFMSNLNAVREALSEGIDGSPPAILQCEIAYINHLGATDEDIAKVAHHYMRDLGFIDAAAEKVDISIASRISQNDRPIGRLYTNLRSKRTENGKRVLALEITARGTPTAPNPGGTIDFLTLGRSLIVDRFAEITSIEAHREWGRIEK